MSIIDRILLLFFLSQFYWLWRAVRFLKHAVPNRRARWLTGAAVAAVYAALMLANLGPGVRRSTPIHLTLHDALVVGPFEWWEASSLAGFVAAILFEAVRAVAWGARRLARRMAERSRPAGAVVVSPARREFLGRTATAVAAAPFVAGAYGLLYGRLNLETTHRRIALPRLPRAFEGFRIAQLSDIHIGPFMPQEEIRKYAAIANELKPDLIALTGDFVTFDPGTQQAVVEAFSGLRAPYGIFGCLGNHDAWAGVEDSIALLFQQAGIRILRGERVPLRSHGETMNLLGVDFQSSRRFGPSPPVLHLLGDIEPLIAPDQVNLLLSHNPDTFNRAAELGIDLSLAGHTHGGQAALEFISPELAPSRFVTPYVSGWFQRPGGQLYVNRGIGTIFVPIRLGAPPEITLFELVRA
jgi:predicted MPP superfamily phosphohydrolase